MRTSILTIILTVMITVMVSSMAYADYRRGDRGATWVKTQPDGVKMVNRWNNPFFKSWQGE